MKERSYGDGTHGTRTDNIARARELLAVPHRPSEPEAAETTDDKEPRTLSHPCPCCGGRMIIIEIFERGSSPKYRSTVPTAAIRIDTS